MSTEQQRQEMERQFSLELLAGISGVLTFMDKKREDDQILQELEALIRFDQKQVKSCTVKYDKKPKIEGSLFVRINLKARNRAINIKLSNASTTGLMQVQMFITEYKLTRGRVSLYIGERGPSNIRLGERYAIVSGETRNSEKHDNHFAVKASKSVPKIRSAARNLVSMVRK